jgi:DnaJ domain
MSGAGRYHLTGRPPTPKVLRRLDGRVERPRPRTRAASPPGRQPFGAAQRDHLATPFATKLGYGDDMAMPSDLYERLQVHPAAGREVIRAAYLVLAKQRHPDAGGTTDAMAALNEAWAVLGDPARRAAYDASRGVPPVVTADGPTREDRRSARVATPAPRSGGASSRPLGTTLDFGRYAGMTLERLAREDPDYLEWLARSPGGRQYHAAITALLARASSNVPRATQAPLHRGGWRLPWRARAAG